MTGPVSGPADSARPGAAHCQGHSVGGGPRPGPEGAGGGRQPRVASSARGPRALWWQGRTDHEPSGHWKGSQRRRCRLWICSSESGSSFLGPLKGLSGVTASSFWAIIEEVTASEDKRAASSQWQSNQRAGLHRTQRTALLDVRLGAIPRGLGGGLRRILRGPASASRGGRPDGGRLLLLRSLGLLCWMKALARHFQALPPASLAASSVASYDATGPYAANCGRLWPHRKPAEYSRYDSQCFLFLGGEAVLMMELPRHTDGTRPPRKGAGSHRAVLPVLRHGGTNPRREYCPVPDSGRSCARV